MTNALLASALCVVCLACGRQPSEVHAVTASSTSSPSNQVAAVKSPAHPPEATAAEPTAAEPTATSAHHCEGSPALCLQNAAPPAPRPATGGDLYGAEMDSSIALTALSELMTRPKDFADNVVRTTGTIGRVCQHRGCWMELRGASGDSVVRVPMAGHAFFVPADSSGRIATVQGVASVREGTENPLRIDATSVLIARAQ